MNWDQIEGQWHQFTGQLTSKWGKLTDDDVRVIAGKRAVLTGKLQARYGVIKDDAEKQIDEWLATLMTAVVPSKASTEATKTSSEKIGKSS